MNIVHFFADGASELNSAIWRTLIPTAALRRAGHSVHTFQIEQWMRDDPAIRPACARADLIIIQRVLVEESLPRAAFWRQRGKAVIVDFDDAYQLIRDDNRAHQFWGKGEVEVHGPGFKFTRQLEHHPLQQFIAGLRQITGATMPSQVLAADWRWAAPCWVVPNYVDSDRYRAARRTAPRRTREIMIGYGGSMSHVPSFRDSGVEQALARVAARRPAVRFLICGDERVHARLPVPAHQKAHQHYVRWHEWPGVLARFDIGLAPLAGRYDASRSDIKTTEYALMGIPFVATASPTYDAFRSAGVGCYVPDGDDAPGMAARAEAWEAALIDMIDRLDDWRARAADWDEPCLHLRDADRNVGALAEVYERIVAHG